MRDLLKENAEIAARFEEIRNRLRGCNSIEEVFITWCNGMEQVFAIPFLWVTVIDDEVATPVREAVRSLDLFRHRLNLVPRSIFEQVTAGRRDPILVSKNIRPYFPLFPPHKYLLRSMAIAPFTIGEEVAGSLNHGDPSPDRYRPEMDTTLLASFVHSISHRLTELVYFP